MDLLIPKPLSVVKTGAPYTLPSTLTIAVAPATPEVNAVARELAELLQRSGGSEACYRR